MEHLEGYYHAGNSVLTNRLTSRLSNTAIIPASGYARLGGTSSTLSCPSLISGQATQYEHELEASRVYRKAQGGVDNVSVRRSFANSHARSAFSDISLSDISALSVVAIPLFRTEITNAYHYSARPRNNHRPGCKSCVWKLQIPELNKHSLLRSLSFPRLVSQAGLRPSQQNTMPLPTELKLVIIGATEADIYALVIKVRAMANMNTKELHSSFVH
jgi:hypothetical protein